MYDTEAEIKAQVGKTKGDTLIEEVFAAFMRGDMFPPTPRIGFVGPTDRTCCWLLTIKEFNKINGMRPCVRLKTVSTTCQTTRVHGSCHFLISDGGPLAQKADPTSTQCRQMTARNARAPALKFAVSTPGNESGRCGEGEYHTTWGNMFTAVMFLHFGRACTRTLPCSFTFTRTLSKF
jgi:hypothetical protein